MKRLIIALMTLLCVTQIIPAARASAQRFAVNTDICAAVLESDGSVVTEPGRYKRILPLLDGSLFAVRDADPDSQRYALADKNGDLITGFDFDMIGDNGQKLIIRKKNLFGLITPNGDEALAVEWTSLVSTDGDYWLGTRTDLYDDEPDTVFVIDPNGWYRQTDIRSDVPLADAGSNRVRFRDGGTERYGYLDGQGVLRVEARYETASDYANGRAAVSIDGRFGLIDTDGNWLLSARYDAILTNDAWIVALREGTCTAFRSETMEEVFETPAWEAGLIGGWLLYKSGKGTFAYRPESGASLSMGENARLREGCGEEAILVDGLWGSACECVINTQGEAVSPLMQYITPLDDHYYLFTTMNARSYYSSQLGGMRLSVDYDSMRCGVCTGLGETVVEARYRRVTEPLNGYFVLEDEDSVTLVDAGGAVLWRWTAIP